MGNTGTQLTVVCMHAVPAGWFTGERKWPTLVLNSQLCACMQPSFVGSPQGEKMGQHWYSAESCVHACSPGWLVHWGEKMANTSAQVLTDSFSEILAYNQGSGSVNFYMAHGGTNFGWTAGKTQLWTSKCTFKSW